MPNQILFNHQFLIGLNDASSFDEKVMEYKEKVKDDSQQVLLNLEN
jgi:hypothetical protein